MLKVVYFVEKHCGDAQVLTFVLKIQHAAALVGLYFANIP